MSAQETKVVPVEIAEEMINAAEEWYATAPVWSWFEMWDVLLAAAPPATAPAEPGAAMSCQHCGSWLQPIPDGTSKAAFILKD